MKTALAVAVAVVGAAGVVVAMHHINPVRVRLLKLPALA